MPQIPYKSGGSVVQAYVQTSQNAYSTPRRPMFEGKLGLYRSEGLAITSEATGESAAEDVFSRIGQNLVEWYAGPSISVGDVLVVRPLSDCPWETTPSVFLCESYGWLSIPEECTEAVLLAVQDNDIEALDGFDQQRLEWATNQISG